MSGNSVFDIASLMASAASIESARRFANIDLAACMSRIRVIGWFR